MGMDCSNGYEDLVAEEDLTQGIACVRVAQGDGIAAQGFGDAEGFAAIAEPALGLDLTHLKLRRILDRRQSFGKRKRTWAITGNGSIEAERVVRTHQVVAVAEAIELALAVLEAGEVEVAQDFELKRAMEALVLALGLRMIRTTVADSDAEPNQPQAKGGERVISLRAPRSAVVHQNRGRQAIAAKGVDEHGAYGFATLVGAGLKHQREARMVVEHGQRMAAGAIEEGEVALEVHLPQLVGYRSLKALKGTRRRRSLIEQTMAAQDTADSARREFGAALEDQPSGHLASAPTAKHPASYSEHMLFEVRRGEHRAAWRPPRVILETAAAFQGVTLQPLVAGLRRDPEPPAELAPISALLHRQLHKLLAQQHPGNLPPRHPAHLPLEIQHAA